MQRADALALGGYREEDYPSGDHFFFAPYAQRHVLAQHRRVLACFRIAVNETQSEAVIQRLILSTWRLQNASAGTSVPKWWRHLIPLATACELKGWNSFWNVDIKRETIEVAIGVRLPRPHKRLYNTILLALGGF